jgi:hypothetical protein
MKTTLFHCLLMTVLLAAGCDRSVSIAINNYYAQAGRVRIGDTKEKVMEILGSTQDGLSPSQRKTPETFVKDGKTTEIYYFRTLSQGDTILTDDEFTPYVFEDGKLVAIGWAYLGGPKTQAYPTPETRIEVHGGYGHW